jgi:hypothetical protein
MADDKEISQEKESGELPLNLIHFRVIFIYHLIDFQVVHGELNKTVKENLQPSKS